MGWLADAIGTLINKFLDPEMDLSPAGIDNHSMGTVFEELVRKFNEENNEEAGEHWTPRDFSTLPSSASGMPDTASSGTGSSILTGASSSCCATRAARLSRCSGSWACR